MQSEEKKEKEVILEPYLSEIDSLRKLMEFHEFTNSKPYSFDYNLKTNFEAITTNINAALKKNPTALISPSLTNRLPIFLPSDVRRIAFFSYRSKSVRPVDIDELKNILTKQAEKRCRSGKLRSSEISQYVREDLEAFNKYDKEHHFDAYRRDIFTKTIQFNAYDEEDNLLMEKSFVRGGLVFDIKEEEFDKKIDITYPRHRKQRSDKKTEYLPLKLIDIRGMMFSKGA